MDLVSAQNMPMIFDYRIGKKKSMILHRVWKMHGIPTSISIRNHRFALLARNSWCKKNEGGPSGATTRLVLFR
jgi:hypothetical protein